MQIFDRLSYALIGLVFGALIGVACWWLYGLAFSLAYDGPGIDPSLKHWVGYIGATFAVLGFLFRGGVGDAIGHVLSAIFFFEANDTPGRSASPWVGILLVAIVLAALWFSSR